MPPESVPGAPAPHPLRPAASLILVASRPAVRVLWVRRSEANPFLGGFHSFPGGRLAKEDGSPGGDAAAREPASVRCAVRETFEETGLLIGLGGRPPAPEALPDLRRRLLEGKAEFWPEIERLGMTLEPSTFRPAGRWITPHFGSARFDTMFFLHETAVAAAPDVWPGELDAAEWIEPDRALSLWSEDRVGLAMPTLHALRVIAEGTHDLARRLKDVPEANGKPSRFVDVRAAITMVPLRTETIAPASHTNAIVIGDGDAVVVDPGTADEEELKTLFEVVDAATAGGGSVKAVLLTHRHKDHVLGADAVRKRYGAPVWAHGLAGDLVRLDRELRDGERIEIGGRHPRVIRAIFAPGHSRSHVAFFEETSRTLCAGDLVSTLGTVVIDPPDGAMSDYLVSLERIRTLGATALIPGHGPPSRGVDHALRGLIEHRRMRESRVLDALEDGPLAVEALREEVYRDTPGAPAALAARTLEAHLEKLLSEGRIRREGRSVALTPAAGAAPPREEPPR
ncbi:MAG: MBL fold metallo-hydrolase [Candidatus Latescibacteria bacterium]|nr:MBL fold metallo-hydrolase [Candidatus Latescibacterota bacterium]